MIIAITAYLLSKIKVEGAEGIVYTLVAISLFSAMFQDIALFRFLLSF